LNFRDLLAFKAVRGEFVMSNDVIHKTRRNLLVGMTTAVGAIGVVGVAIPFLGSWSPSAKAKAAGASVRIDIGKIEAGRMVTEEWRGMPVYVLRHTQATLDSLKKVQDILRDPESNESKQPDYAKNESRSIKREFTLLMGVCTHLGCAPTFRPDVGAADLGGDKWQGGFFCACHGSKYDLAGRVYKGVPAPLNLEVPKHMYESDNVVIIGEDQGA
jgi:ubiquinol-cytochrome c reductase iron-sulfur subunit